MSRSSLRFKRNIDKTLLELRQVLAYREFFRNLVLRDLKVRYKRSVLGFLWVMLNPLLMMLVMYTVFSQLFRHTLVNYSAYIMSGLVLWNMFAQSTSVATQSFLGNSNLLKKIFLPKMIFPLSCVTSGLVNFCFSLIPLSIILFLSGTQLSPRAVFLPLCLIEILVFSSGIALFLATAVVFFHDAVYIYDVILLAGMYFSPIFYPVSIVPETVAKAMQFNPLYHYLIVFRGLLYDTSVQMEALGTHLFYGFLFAVFASILGLWFYAVNRDRLLFYL